MPKRTGVITAIAVAIALSLAGAARQRAVRPTALPSAGAPTFSKEVVRIFQKHCQTCHHPGDIGPMSLMTYESSAPYATLIKLMTQMRLMPPWKAAEGCGEFVDARVMTADEIDTIARWADAGAPRGNPADLPTPLTFDSGWTLGPPDVVLSNAEPYTPPAAGDMYRCFTTPARTESRWVSAIDIHPGDRQSVHHVIAFVDLDGVSAQLDAADSEPGYQCFGDPGFSNAGTLGGWAPGMRPLTLPEDVAYELPAKSRVVLQVHYHPHHGAPKPDQTEIGIYYAKTLPKQPMRVLPLINTEFVIPAGDANYPVTAEFTVPSFIGGKVWFIAPHMHLLGRKMRVDATLPSGESKCLINIEEWDFNWQTVYRYKDPIPIPPGTHLKLTAYYDNSAANFRNPNVPPKAVRWGEATTDEMCIAFLGVTIDGDNVQANLTADTSWLPRIR